MVIAGLFETAFAFCMGNIKESTGRMRYLWITGFVVCLSLSMILLAVAVRTLPVGTAYPVWTGIGAVGTVLLGIIFFKERVTSVRLFFIIVLIASIVGLKMI